MQTQKIFVLSGEMIFIKQKVSFCVAYIKWISTASRYMQTAGKKTQYSIDQIWLQKAEHVKNAL